LAATLALFAAGSALAQGQSQGKGGGKPAHAGAQKNHGKPGGDATTAATAAAVIANVLLSDRDRVTIRQYFEQHPRPATDLPPGIAKNLARGKPLPPGIAKRGVPNDLWSRLSIPAGYELQTVGTDVVLIEAGTRVLADILRDVLRN
jgi:hypothetical protein